MQKGILKVSASDMVLVAFTFRIKIIQEFSYRQLEKKIFLLNYHHILLPLFHILQDFKKKIQK